jgi:hypothetical protein
MRLFPLSLTIVFLSFGETWGRAGEVLTPAEAAKQEGKDKKITVGFVVQSCHPVLPDGKHFRLFSTKSFKAKETFVVDLSGEALKKLGTKDLEKYFMGKKVRVTGKVGKTVFSSTSATRPGISVDDPKKIEVVKE